MRLQIRVGKAAAVAVRVEPMMEMRLIEIRGGDFRAEVVRVRARKRDVQANESGDERLQDAIGVGGTVRIARFHFAERGSDDEQPICRTAHAAQARDEDIAAGGEGMNEIGEALALDDARVFEAGDGIVSEGSARRSMRPNQRAKRENENGSFSRVSIMSVARGARIWTPPRSAMTGIGGWRTVRGSAASCHSRGDSISVRRRRME